MKTTFLRRRRQTSTVSRHPAPPRTRYPRRRLYQGSAILLLVPCAAAFLPVQGRVPEPTRSLVPVTPVAAAALPTPAPLPQRLEAAATHLIHRASRVDASPLSGLASWYGDVLRGHHTASGEVFNPDELTACSRTLPFGTLVRVVNLLNHRSVTVRITDRGVLNADRVIDLSSAAAQEIDMLHSGVAPVRLEIQKALEQKPAAPESPESEADPDGGF